MKRCGDQVDIRTRRTFAALATLKDEELVELVRKGSPRAYHILIERYEALVRMVVSKCLRNDRMAVEDACQETYLKALVRIKDLRKPSRFKSWVCAIARNQALDILRRRKRVVSWNSSGYSGNSDNQEAQPIWQIPDTKSNPAERHARMETDGVVKDILDDIPELYRYPLSMRYEQDLDYQEIADLLGKPLGTIKSLIHRGKAKVRLELTRRAGGHDGAMVLAG